jgi:hypothetical protein
MPRNVIVRDEVQVSGVCEPLNLPVSRTQCSTAARNKFLMN